MTVKVKFENHRCILMSQQYGGKMRLMMELKGENTGAACEKYIPQTGLFYAAEGEPGGRGAGVTHAWVVAGPG